MRAISITGKRVPLALAVMILVITGAGAAAGVTFEGDVQGDSVTKVDQAILINNTLENGSNANNALGKVSDDQTKFRFAANVNQGDQYKVGLNLTNEATQDLNGQLSLNVPAPLEVEVTANGSNMEIARTSLGTWNFNIDSAANGQWQNLVITIAVPDDAPTGFYTIEAEIRPAEV